MENNTKRYWTGLEELRNDTNFIASSEKEFNPPTETDVTYEHLTDGTGTHRRDFLKTLGFGMAAVSLASCEAPVRKAVSYINKPAEEYPTIANWYASTFAEAGDYASILVKTREGRPIKIEPNKPSGISYGASARAHASLLGLYDIEKLKGPSKGGSAAEWETVDSEIESALASIAASGGDIRIVSTTLLSPSTKAVINDFIAKYPTTSHVVYDTNSLSALIEANRQSFGKAVVPSYDFSKVKVVVSVDADFLGTWLSPDHFSGQFAQTRKVSSAEGGHKEMSRHYQCESILSLTGSNADYRTAVKPSQLGLVVASRYNKVAAKTGGSPISVPSIDVPHLDKAANDLIAA